MNKIAILIILAVLISGISSCRVINTLTGNDTNLKKVGDLWSDVPRLDGMTSSEADMPIFVKLLLRTALNNMYRLNRKDEDRTPASGDWAVFTTTRSAQDIRDFYTNERMTTFGNWEASKESTCVDGKEEGFSGVACVFKKVVDKRGIGLLIVAQQDEKKKETILFFVRVENDEPATKQK